MGYNLHHFGEDGEIIQILDNIRKTRSPIRTVAFIYDLRGKPLLDVLEKSKPENYCNSKFSIKKETHNFVLLSLEINKSRAEESRKHIEDDSDEDESEELLEEFESVDELIKKTNETNLLLIYKQQPFAIYITNAVRTRFLSNLKFFNKYYPFFSRIFFRSKEIRSILDKLVKHDELQIEVVNYVLKRYYVNKRVDMGWEKVDYHELFERAYHNFLWVDGIYITVASKEFSGKIRVNRKGIIQYEDLAFYTINDLVLNDVLQKYEQTHKEILSVRTRNLKHLEASPIKLILREEAFKSVDDIKQFIHLAEKGLREWGHSLLYVEGIHLCMILHDYEAGSSFDLYITSSNEIIIIPQTQVTSVSLNKLVSHIIENYDAWVENAGI